MKTGTTKVYGPIWIDPDRMSGAPCFTGTRVPVASLFDWLSAGRGVDEFIASFPSVGRDQVSELFKLTSVIMAKEHVIHENPVGREPAH